MSELNLKRFPEEWELKDVYTFDCAACGATQTLKPSILMLMGMNSGHGSCLRCKEFLHLEIDENNDKGVSQLWNAFVEQITPKPHAEFYQ